MKSINSISDIVAESLKKVFVDQTAEAPEVRMVTIGKEELEYGSPEHISALKNILTGLEHLRSLYSKGSSVRHIYSNAHQRLRHLILKLEPAKD
jgi:hypothetical protein